MYLSVNFSPSPPYSISPMSAANSSSRDRWATIPAPIASPSTFTTVRKRSLENKSEKSFFFNILLVYTLIFHYTSELYISKLRYLSMLNTEHPNYTTHSSYTHHTYFNIIQYYNNSLSWELEEIAHAPLWVRSDAIFYYESGVSYFSSQ